MDSWLPKSFIALRDYNRQTSAADAIAGVTVGLVALPLAMAFAIASGMPNGPFLFGTTDQLDRIGDLISSLPPVVILRLRHVPAMDASGLQALEDLADQLKDSGRTLVLCGARDQPARLMERAEFHEHVGEGNVCANIRDALTRAEQIAGASVLRN